jgi:hypothetical protein
MLDYISTLDLEDAMRDQLPTYELGQVLPGGFHMPTRMTVLPLEGGDVALISPIRLDAETAAAIEASGPVRYLVAPNLLHHLYLGAASERWPNARVLAPAALRAKRPDLRIDAALEDGLPSDLSRSVRTVKIDGAPSLDEFVFFHEPSRTLVVTELAFNITKPRGLMAHVVLFLVGCHGRLAQSRAWRMFVKDRAAAARSARAVLSLGFETLVVAHGEIVENNARERLEGALAWMLRGDALARAEAARPPV